MAPGVREGVTEADSRDGSAPEPRGLSLPGSPGGGRAAETGWPWLGLFEVSGAESQAPPGWGDWGPTAVQDGTFEWGRGRAALAPALCRSKQLRGHRIPAGWAGQPQVGRLSCWHDRAVRAQAAQPAKSRQRRG